MFDRNNSSYKRHLGAKLRDILRAPIFWVDLLSIKRLGSRHRQSPSPPTTLYIKRGNSYHLFIQYKEGMSRQCWAIRPITLQQVYRVRRLNNFPFGLARG